MIWWHRTVPGPIVIYQPGKVGSQAVYVGLTSLALRQPVHHVHFLTRFDELEAQMRGALRDATASLGKLTHDREVRQALLKRPDQPWNVITLVRDPVARNISTFFQIIDGLFPDLQA